MQSATDEDEASFYEDYRLTPRAIVQYMFDPCKQQHMPYILQACSKDGFLLEQLQPACRNVKPLVLAAVRASGSALQFASTALKADKAVVSAAIRSDPFALEYACRSLKRDARIVLQAVRKMLLRYSLQTLSFTAMLSLCWQR
ncbi:hypothetical protein COO60DRAFT_211210 [Scenedesmus sp. NREL 46B-D3]|nr:hypothetical protein COO60DRAFT_211210 [Scenedesmus sp. NREL 46B-D3]